MAILERTLVQSESKMTRKIFAKHMEKRHSESLGYLGRLPLKSVYLMRMWRSFHNQLHKFRVDLDHEHGAA